MLWTKLAGDASEELTQTWAILGSRSIPLGFFACDTRRDVKRPLTTRCRICSACPGCGFLGESAAASDFGISVMNSSQRLRLEEKEEQEAGQACQLVSHLTSVFYSFVESYNPNSTHEQNLQTQAGSRLLCFVEEHQTTNSEHAQKHRRPQTPTSLRDRVCRTISTHEHTHTQSHSHTLLRADWRLIRACFLAFTGTYCQLVVGLVHRCMWKRLLILVQWGTTA